MSVTFSEWMVQNKLDVAFSKITNQIQTSHGFQLNRPGKKLPLDTIKKQLNSVDSGKLKKRL